ncbi:MULTISPECIES: glycosyltransferase N-terminal domain-containing protein [unclassified Spirosoma]|uniref:3-deoxy-D-manno-octulosonic acid transferase n=1 Tax=unclassified Spirosoma TaxID=2621999 RepID=UPI0009693FA7|nr:MULTISPECIES: glycosyltransferase N-terminal domain-containing protein [unclassified Spirosoma]MBN8824591.1 3-deoxy-D-manno-octulosonic acid transferase [Spirosoma sp.]OJW70952.1 MAG: 3-deoxy-D-manno-octulosonic acid transferase [Spirosoma sp. 48-14]
MFSGLYNAGILVFQQLVKLAARFNPKARQWNEGRRDWAEKLTVMLAGNTSPIVWFHAASLGEFEQGRPVMEAFRKTYPAYKILLTFFSPSGYEVRKNYDGADYILYLPADTPANARQFIQIVMPQLAFFIKYEFWYNYLRELNQAAVPTISFSAIFRPDQLFFKPYGGFYRSLLRYFDHILVQNQESLDLLKQLDLKHSTLAGDTRFDRVAQVAAAKQEIPLAQRFKDNQPVLVVGSAWPEDMHVIIPFLNAFDKPLKAIIAPHEILEAEIEHWRTLLKKSSIRFSQANAADASRAEILFIDNVGMLSSLYQYGEFAFIGGAFKQGLHNILEAATFGMPLFFGPEYSKYQEAVDLVAEGAAFPVSTTTELMTAFSRQYGNPTEAAQISRQYVQRNIGATAKVMQVVEQIKRERVNS